MDKSIHEGKVCPELIVSILREARKPLTTKQLQGEVKRARVIPETPFGTIIALISMLSTLILYNKIWQFPVILLPISHKKEQVLVLRPVYSKEAMTAKFATIPITKAKKLAKQLTKLKGISAVLYDVTHKPPGTIEWE